jgi:ribonuclease P protein component
MKHGRKASTQHLVIYLNSTSSTYGPRFGFVVAKTVGSAVQRNLVKRRARAAVRERLNNFANGQDLVVRALPGLAEISWSELSAELDSCLAEIRIK